jgi:hypothetical protein
MNSKLAILLSLVMASGIALAGGDQTTGAADQSGMGQEQQQAPSFSEVDTNSDGLISEDDAQGHEWLADNFDQADANADGYINQSEYDSLLGQQELQE